MYYTHQNEELKKLLKIKELSESTDGLLRYFMCSKIVGQENINKINKSIKKVAKLK